MKVVEVEAVLNARYGGFSINTEMALWLMEKRGWLITNDYDYQKKDYPINMLFEQKVGLKDYYYSPNHDNVEFRSHKDLIDCIKELQEKHKDDPYPESYYGHIQGLKIVTVKVHLEVEDCHDGKEKINCSVENANN